MFQKNERRKDEKKPVQPIRSTIKTHHDPPTSELKQLQHELAEERAVPISNEW